MSSTVRSVTRLKLGLFLWLAAGALTCVSVATAAGPPSALLQAVARTDAARSATLSLGEVVKDGAQTATVDLSGVEDLATGSGSYNLALTPSESGFGEAKEIVTGGSVYVQYAALPALHAKTAAIRTWIVVDSNSGFAIQPSNLTFLTLPEVKLLTNVKSLGRATIGGETVTRYSGSINLRDIAGTPLVARLLANLPSAAASVFSGTEKAEFSVGAGGYVVATTVSFTMTLPGSSPLKIAVNLRYSGFDHSKATFAAPSASSVMTLARFLHLSGSPALTVEAAVLEQIALHPTQLGTGYQLEPIPGGQLVAGEVTLNFCDLSYPSESLRTARLQVVYTAPGNTFEASNEVVSYKSGGAQKALAEVTKAAASCRNGHVSDAASGFTDLVRHTHVVSDAHLLPGAVAILETDSGMVNGKRVTVDSMDVYQVRGDVLSGVYGRGPTVAAVERDTLRAAEQSADNLRRLIAAPAKAPPAALTA